MPSATSPRISPRRAVRPVRCTLVLGRGPEEYRIPSTSSSTGASDRHLAARRCLGSNAGPSSAFPMNRAASQASTNAASGSSVTIEAPVSRRWTALASHGTRCRLA
jgi:hypothetical protein